MAKTELPNLPIPVPQNVADYANARGEDFSALFSHCMGHIQADEIKELKGSGEYVRGALLKMRPRLATTVALNPGNASTAILKEVSSLSSEEIASILKNVEKEYPVWARAVGSIFKSILSEAGHALIDDMFEIDSKAVTQANEQQFKDVLNLVYLVGLTIPETMAQGSRVETWLENQEQ